MVRFFKLKEGGVPKKKRTNRAKKREAYIANFKQFIKSISQTHTHTYKYIAYKKTYLPYPLHTHTHNRVNSL